MIPYVGDAAKLGKLGKYAQTVAKAIDAAHANPALRQARSARHRAIGGHGKLLLDKLPESARKQLTTLKKLTSIFAKESDTAARTAWKAADDVPTTGAARASAAAFASRAARLEPCTNGIEQTGYGETGFKQQKLTKHSPRTTTRACPPPNPRRTARKFNKVKNS